MAQDLGADWEVVTDGLPGRTSVHEDLIEGGARNGLAVLPSALHAHKPLDLLILMLGTNDLKPRFGVSAHEIAQGMGRLIQCAQQSGVVKDILLVCPAPVREIGLLADGFAGAETRQQGMAQHMKQVAQRHGCGFFDAGTVVQVSDTDGVHLDTDAQVALGHAMAAHVKTLEG